jgi:opacity protein-like surface antigen
MPLKAMNEMNRAVLLQNVPHNIARVLATVVFLGYSSDLNAADNQQDDAWHFTLIPYIWAPSFDGSMKVQQPPGYTGGNVGFLENLNFVAMGSFEARKQRWSILGDTIYIDFSDPNRVAEFPGVPGGTTIKAETGLKGFIFQGVGAHSAFRNERMNFDVLTGVRYARLESKLALNISGTLPPWVGSRSTSVSENFVDPIVGFKGRFQLSKKWYAPYYFDVGGFGLDSDLTMQADAGIHYSIRDWVSVGLDYRYLHYDFGNEKMLLNDLTLSGPMLGIGFHF